MWPVSRWEYECWKTQKKNNTSSLKHLCNSAATTDGSSGAVPERSRCVSLLGKGDGCSNGASNGGRISLLISTIQPLYTHKLKLHFVNRSMSIAIRCFQRWNHMKQFVRRISTIRDLCIQLPRAINCEIMQPRLHWFKTSYGSLIKRLFYDLTSSKPKWSVSKCMQASDNFKCL